MDLLCQDVDISQSFFPQSDWTPLSTCSELSGTPPTTSQLVGTPSGWLESPREHFLPLTPSSDDSSTPPSSVHCFMSDAEIDEFLNEFETTATSLQQSPTCAGPLLDIKDLL